MAKRRKRQANPGAELRAIRQQLGWSLREVHATSVALARKHRQPAFVIAPSVLHRIETRNSTPEHSPLVRTGTHLWANVQRNPVSVRNSIVTGDLFCFQNKPEALENHGRFAAIPSLL